MLFKRVFFILLTWESFSAVLGSNKITSNMSICATVLPSCTMTVNNLNFGSYDPRSTSTIQGQTNISVSCVKGLPYTLSLNQGSTGGATFNKRLMASGQYTLTYNLYTDNNYAVVWGDGSIGTSVVNGSGQGLNTQVTHTVYGQIFPSQDVAPGTYYDVVQVTLVS